MDVYRIGVSIALANGVSAVLGVIQKDVMGLKKAVDLTNGSLSRMKIVAGMALAGIGGAALAGFNKLEKAGEKYVEQLEQIKAAGYDVAQQQQMINAANRVASSVRTTNPTENLEALRRLTPALNSKGKSPQDAVNEATEYLEVVQKAKMVMDSTVGGRKAAADGGLEDMVKALEEIGATREPARFERLLGGMVKASEAFGGAVTGRDWLQTLKYTRGAGIHYTDDFIMYYLPTLIQEAKAGRGTGAGGGPGAPLASFFQEVVGNRFGRDTRELGIQLGLIDPKKSTVDKHGRIHNKPGAFYGAGIAAENPELYTQQYVIPLLSRQMGGHMMDRNESGQFVHVQEMATTLATLYGNRTTQWMMGLLLQVPKMEGDKQLVQQAHDMNTSAADLSKNNPTTVLTEFNAQLERLEADLGKALVPLKMGFLTTLTDGLVELSKLSEKYPNATAWIVGTTAALSGLLVVMGGIAIFAAAVSALTGSWFILGIVTGITALTAALYGLWKHANLRQLASDISDGFHRITGAIVDWIKTIPSIAAQVAAELSKIGQAILGWAKGLFSSAQASGPAPSASAAEAPHPSASGLINPADPNAARPGGSLFHKGSFVPPAANNNHVTLINYTVLDGKVIAKDVSSLMARNGSGPSGGATGFDGRAGYVGGMQMGAA